MKKRKIIIIIVICILLILVGLFIFNKFKDNSSNELSEYIINYQKNDNLNLSYLISINKDYDITVVVNSENESQVSPTLNNEYNFNFSDENKELLKEYLKKVFKNKKTNTIKLTEKKVDKNDLKIIKSIINNNELHMYTDEFKIIYKDRNCNMLHDLYINNEYVCSLNCHSVENTFIKLSNGEEYPLEMILTEDILDIEELKEEGLRYRVIKEKIEKKLVFKINFGGLNCITPNLFVYDDNTYKIGYTISESETNSETIKGIYEYDVNKIIENINNYESGKIGPYYITDSDGNTYTTYDTNVELKEFLNSINVNLETCMK